MIYFTKIVIAVLLMLAASEAGKRVPVLGAAIVSLPLASMIVMSFMYYDTRNALKVAEFARAVPPIMIPSVLFFYAYAFLVESQVGFVMAMLLATAIMLAGYGIFILIIRP